MPEIFKQQQYAFAAHIRDPLHKPKPAGIEDRRMAIYRELFFNNIEGFLSGTFPVLRKLTSDEKWHRLVRQFLVDHQCKTPHFPEIAQEFIAYLQTEHQLQEDDYPFMLELAHYEWVEMALAISDADEETPVHDPNGDLINGIPVISPLAWSFSYQFPVQRISPEYLPQEIPNETTHLVIYRDRFDAIHFLEVNAVTQRLLELLRENADFTGSRAIETIAEELQHPNPNSVIQHGKQLLLDLKERNIILGEKK